MKYLVFIDDIAGGNGNLPPTIGGHRPDVAWVTLEGRFRYIGEAKTRNDVINAHTNSQLRAFMRVLHEQESGELVVAVPWGLEETMQSLLDTIQRQEGLKSCEWLVISDAPSEEPQA